MDRIIDNWHFEVDKNATAHYSAQELSENCQCEDCLHFYRHVEHAYPSLRAFLDSFGVELFAPESMITYNCKTYTEHSLAYLVYGRIVKFGDSAIKTDHTLITAEHVDDEIFYLTFSVMLPSK